MKMTNFICWPVIGFKYEMRKKGKSRTSTVPKSVYNQRIISKINEHRLTDKYIGKLV
jgi:hypothetical protein